jgi:lysophospholipase L1-like esterase
MTDIKKPPKGKKLLLFKVLAVLFPFILLFLLEIALRICNYGHNTALFVKYVKDDRFMQMNYYASERFFSDTVNATQGSNEIFTINKASNTFRIFVLGESTTIGYPYFHNGSFHRWLQFRLMQMYPDKNFEIVNTSLTAVNSYTVLDFGRQLIKYQPDAVMIYTGHNEYYGALGIGSTSYVGSNHFLVETLLKLRELKLVQLLNNAINKVSIAFSNNKIDTRQTLMQRMAARQKIPFGSKDYQAGIDQFDRNISELCGLLNDKKVPVFLSTVVSNEKDLPPFISNGSGPGSAMYYYKSGQTDYAQGKYSLAKQEFDKAKEFDELRFRAPEAINTIVKKIAGEYRNVHLVNTKKLFEQLSPHGIIGNETILEHVHPNLYGYAIMSEAFYQAFQQQHLIADTPQKVIAFSELRNEMPLTRMDSLNGEFQIMMLKSSWPFNQPEHGTFRLSANLEDTLAGKVSFDHMQWKDAMESIFDRAMQTHDKEGARRVVEAMALEYPQSKQFSGLAANLNTTLQNYNMAALYYKKLEEITANYTTTPKIIKLYLRAGEPDKAMESVKDLSPVQQDQVGKIINQIIADKHILRSQRDNKLANNRIIANYKKLGIPDSLINKNMK